MQNPDGDKAFSSIDFVGQCLVDEERTIAFQKAIQAGVKKGDKVLDLGTGSGILSALAAQAGAGKVVAIEYDSFVASIAAAIIRANGLEGSISVLEHDARTLSFEDNMRFDVVLAEMLTTGMVDEHQVAAINNLHTKKFVDASTVFIPERQDTFVELAHSDYALYGLKTQMILHLWKWHDWKNLALSIMSGKVLLNSIDFKLINKEQFDGTIELITTRSGAINSIHLTSVSIISGTVSVGDTEALNSPMLIPIAERVVEEGEKIRVRISYTFGGGYGTLKSRFV